MAGRVAIYNLFLKQLVKMNNYYMNSFKYKTRYKQVVSILEILHLSIDLKPSQLTCPVWENSGRAGNWPNRKEIRKGRQKSKP